MSEPKTETKKIDITSSAIEKGLDLVKDFLSKIVGPSAEELGLLASDNIRLWRFKNQISILEKAQNYVAEKGIEIKGISPKILVPLLEGASLEEDKSLQDMWTSLLVNYIDSKKAYASSVFPYILSQLSSDEAGIVGFIYNNNPTRQAIIFMLFKASDSEISNLTRLGLIRRVIGIGASDDQIHEITGLGKQFIIACRLDK